jgi:hypothetical protein
LATDYSPAEIAFFKAIVSPNESSIVFWPTEPHSKVEQIMLAPREAFSASSMAALRELTASKSSITKINAEVVLTSFVSKGWLLKSAQVFSSFLSNFETHIDLVVVAILFRRALFLSFFLI